MTSSATPPKFRFAADSRSEARAGRGSGVHCSVTPQARGQEINITVRPMRGEGMKEMFNRLAAVLQELEATVVHLMVFGSVQASAAASDEMRRIFGGLDWPVT